MARQHLDNQTVIEHVMQDKTALETAMACVKAFSDIALAIITDFTTAIERQLTTEGAGKWKVRICNDAEGGPDQERIAITKDGWSELRVVLAHDDPVPRSKKGPCVAYIQVRGNDLDEAGGRKLEADEFCSRLIPVLNSRCGKGKHGKWWPHWYQFPKKYSQWYDPDVLLELYENNKAVDYLVTELVKLMRAVESVREAES